MALTELPVGAKGMIVRIQGSVASGRRLTGLGLLEGEEVEVRHLTPLPVVRIGHLEVAMEPRLAACVLVEPGEPRGGTIGRIDRDAYLRREWP